MINRIGESVIANNGQKMTIIEYYNCRNITVEFEDGTVVSNKFYKDFEKGHIRNPNVKNINKIEANKKRTRFDRVKETNKATNGQKMTIVNYHTFDDIDVQFEDGSVTKHKTYDSFKKGYIRNQHC